MPFGQDQDTEYFEFKIFDRDKFTNDDELGSVRLPVEHLLQCQDETCQYYEISTREGWSNTRSIRYGHLRLKLRFEPDSGAASASLQNLIDPRKNMSTYHGRDEHSDPFIEAGECRPQASMVGNDCTVLL